MLSVGNLVNIGLEQLFWFRIINPRRSCSCSHIVDNLCCLFLSCSFASLRFIDVVPHHPGRFVIKLVHAVPYCITGIPSHTSHLAVVVRELEDFASSYCTGHSVFSVLSSLVSSLCCLPCQPRRNCQDVRPFECPTLFHPRSFPPKQPKDPPPQNSV